GCPFPETRRSICKMSRRTSVVAPPARRGSLTQVRDVQQSADTLMRYLERTIRKVQVDRQLPIYAVFLCLLTACVALESRSWEAGGQLFFRAEALEVELMLSSLRDVSNPTQFWTWFRDTTIQRWALRNRSNPMPDDPNIRVGFLHVRQFRQRWSPALCETSPTYLLPLSIKSRMRDACTEPYSSSTLETADFMPADPTLSFPLNPPPWTTNSGSATGPRQLRSVDRSGFLGSYDQEDKAYTLQYLNNAPLADVLEEIDSLERGRWIDATTRVILIESITYSQAVSSYLLNSFLVEVSTSSVWVASSYPISFVLYFLSDAPRFPLLLLVHVLVLLFIAWDIGRTAQALYRNRVLREAHRGAMLFRRQIRFWGVFQAVTTLLLIVSMYYRLRCWITGGMLGSGAYIRDNLDVFAHPTRTNQALVEGLTLWQGLLEYSAFYLDSRSWFSLALIMSFLRIFGFLQFHTWASMLTETMKTSASDLGKMLLIFLVVLLAFGLGSHVLWNTNKAFRSATSTGTTLMFSAGSGEVKQYAEIEQMHTWLAPIIVAAFLIMSLLIILNTTISIITGSFQLVQDAMQKVRTLSPAAVRKFFSRQLDIVKEKFAVCLGYDTDEESDADEAHTGIPMSSTTGNVKAEPEKKNESYINKRILAYERLQKLREEKRVHNSFVHGGGEEAEDESDGPPDSDLYLTPEEFYDHTSDLFSKEGVSHIYHRASMEIRASVGSIRISEHDSAVISDRVAHLIALITKMCAVDRTAATLHQLYSELSSSLDYFVDIELQAQSQVHKVDELKGISTNIVKWLGLTEGLLAQITALESLHNLLNDGAKETQTVALQASSLRGLVATLQDKLDKKGELLRKAIDKGQEHAVPTSLLKQDAPALMREMRGKGIISDVESYGFVRPVDDAEDDDMPVVVGHLDPNSPMLRKKISSPKLRSNPSVKMALALRGSAAESESDSEDPKPQSSPVSADAIGSSDDSASCESLSGALASLDVSKLPKTFNASDKDDSSSTHSHALRTIAINPDDL
ncbi:Polycystin-2, partial [Diplonema papillatum]